MPGLRIIDHQMRLYMSCRQTHETAVAAAKAGFSTATGYRIENDRSLLITANQPLDEWGKIFSDMERFSLRNDL